MDFQDDGRVSRVALRFGVFASVVLLHLALLALLATSDRVGRRAATPIVPARLILRPHPPPPLRPFRLTLATPLALPVPQVELRIAQRAAVPPRSRRASPPPAPAAHFGVTGAGTGLGLGIAGEAGGGAAARAGLGDFEAEVKRRILAGKHQPLLPWDRRDTCVVNYTVRVSAAGGLVDYTIDPCAVPEINAAAAWAIEHAAPFPHPPLGAMAVRGALVFHGYH